jgi:transposase
MLRTVLMNSDRRSAQVERLEVVDTGRRRRWSEDEKLKIVLESRRRGRSRRRRDNMTYRGRC